MAILYIILAVIGITCIFILVWLLRFKKGAKMLKWIFENENTIVFGYKGAGKDLIFNKVINYRNVPAYANIQYSKELCVVKDIKDFSIAPNTFESLINQDVTIVKKNNKENCDFYISDAGNYLPSQYNNILNKKYPSLPAYYSFSRHLTNSNIHMNTQKLNRPWDKLREQAGHFVRAVHTTKLLNMLITEYVFYDRYESANSMLNPYESTGLIKHSESRANEEDFKAKHGRVERYYICQFIKNVHYDSRWAHRLIYGYNSPTTK